MKACVAYECDNATLTYVYTIALFAWMLEERGEPLTLFMWLLLEKISIYNDKIRTEALADRNVITPPAMVEFDKRLLTFKEFPLVVNAYGEGLYNVHRTVEYAELRPTAYTVDIGGRTCTCQHWYQIGIPCEHAIAVVNHTKDWSNLFTPAYFHRHMLTETRHELFTKHNLCLLLPDDHRVKVNKTLRTFPPLEPVLEDVGELASDVSKKRVASQGESSKPSNIKSGAKRHRYVCKSCGKDLSKNTDHTPGNKACRNHLRRTDPERFEQMYCSELDTMINALKSSSSSSSSSCADQVNSFTDTAADSAPVVYDTCAPYEV